MLCILILYVNLTHRFNLKMEIFDKKTLSYNYEKIIVINSNGLKTLESMSVKKIEYNKFYPGLAKLGPNNYLKKPSDHSHPLLLWQNETT